MSPLSQNSFLSSANSVFIEELYSRYLSNPQSVDPEWQQLFKSLGDDAQAVLKGSKGASWAPKQSAIVGYVDEEARKAANANAKDGVKGGLDKDSALNSIRALMLIRAYKVRGHLLADLDPLGLQGHAFHPDLDPATYGFSESDLDKDIFIGGTFLGLETAKLRDLISYLQQIYSSNIGMEFMHLPSLEQRDWLSAKIENVQERFQHSAEEKKQILQDVLEVEMFEQFLHVKYPGTKRFSIEGGEAAIVAVETVLATSAQHGVKEVVLGMPHRGRLNMLTKVMGKQYASMLSEFQGNLAHPEDLNISGDVKYHLGTSSDRDFDGQKVHLSLTANPSHLEAVNPVVVGKVRAKQDQFNDTERAQVMGILLHGDAAFAGQGVVAETLALSDLKAYGTGGTVHIIVNNQIGFTTGATSGRYSPYCSDVAKGYQAPIFHVHGEDQEAVAYVAKIAAEFRQTFKRDVILDIFCYRRYGHNEGDEPLFTQPIMYQKIAAHPTPLAIYGERLVQDGSISAEELQERKDTFRAFLEKELKASATYKPNKADWLEGKWKGLRNPAGARADADTGVDIKKLKEIGAALTSYPKGFKVNPKLERILEAKKQMIETGKGLDWATGEALAFGSLLLEGHAVRLTGQDCRRGTFSHRHSVFINQEDESEYTPLANLGTKQGRFEVADSNLSEFAVLGFEYGYSLAEPGTLVLWEGQFGDFVNGAQVMIDQFIASAESKWLRMSGLVMLLPHGYEGQGPEHSSARLERFLQLCAEDNMQVVNITTPANYFHALRRQIKREFRKPLIVMSPKSLLRHRLAVSELKDMAKGTSFQRLIPETEKLAEDASIRRMVLCSGKVYYDLLEERTKRNIKDVALVRMEQMYPFPAEELLAEAKRYKNAEVVWCQEEPKNNGAWFFVNPLIEEVLIKAKGKATRPRYVGRDAAASPAAGYAKIHNVQQAALINEALK